MFWKGGEMREAGPGLMKAVAERVKSIGTRHNLKEAEVTVLTPGVGMLALVPTPTLGTGKGMQVRGNSALSQAGVAPGRERTLILGALGPRSRRTVPLTMLPL